MDGQRLHRIEPMTRILYSTDLHGHAAAFDTLLNIAVEEGVSIIVNGGDMLPKEEWTAQRPFLLKFFDVWIEKCQDLGIRYYGMFGNDDRKCVHDEWQRIVEEFPGWCNDLTTQWHTLPGGFAIRGVSEVPDYPFSLKDWVRRDHAAASPVPQLGTPCTSESGRMKVIPDLDEFLNSRPTLEQLLEAIEPPPVDYGRSILVAHAPPRGLDLATLWNGDDVGSVGVRIWIDRHQPLLTLHGHIHESPDAAARLKGAPRHTSLLGRTRCHQPGQRLPRELTYSVIELGETVRIDWRHGEPRPRKA